MDNAKKLKINAALVDMTNTSEESLSAYSEIHVNAGLVLLCEDTRRLLSKYHVTLNTGAALDVPKGVKLRMVNGNLHITKDDVAREPTVMIANGIILIHPDSEEALLSYEMLMFNGNVTCPDNLRGAMSRSTVNGNVNYYPGDAILIEGRLTIDRRFIRKADENSVYYATGEVLMVDDNLDMDALIAKDITVMAGSAVFRAKYEPATDLLDGHPGIRYVPDDYAFIDGGQTMDEALIRRYGKKLFVNGGLTIPDDSAALCAQLEDVIVTGHVKMKEALKMAWLKVISQFGGLILFKGRLIEDTTDMRITNELLGAEPEGLTFHDCVNVHIEPDVLPETIREKIWAFDDCVNIFCSKEQMGTVQLLAKDCINVTALDDKKDENPEEEGSWVYINAASYTM